MPSPSNYHDYWSFMIWLSWVYTSIVYLLFILHLQVRRSCLGDVVDYAPTVEPPLSQYTLIHDVSIVKVVRLKETGLSTRIPNLNADPVNITDEKATRQPWTDGGSKDSQKFKNVTFLCVTVFEELSSKTAYVHITCSSFRYVIK